MNRLLEMYVSIASESIDSPDGPIVRYSKQDGQQQLPSLSIHWADRCAKGDRQQDNRSRLGSGNVVRPASSPDSWISSSTNGSRRPGQRQPRMIAYVLIPALDDSTDTPLPLLTTHTPNTSLRNQTPAHPPRHNLKLPVHLNRLKVMPYIPPTATPEPICHPFLLPKLLREHSRKRTYINPPRQTHHQQPRRPNFTAPKILLSDTSIRPLP